MQSPEAQYRKHVWTGARAPESTSLATGPLLASLKDNAHPRLSAMSHGGVVRDLIKPQLSESQSRRFFPFGLFPPPLVPVPKEGDASRQGAFRRLFPRATPGQARPGQVGWAGPGKASSAAPAAATLFLGSCKKRQQTGDWPEVQLVGLGLSGATWEEAGK